jgi:fluoride exporter
MTLAEVIVGGALVTVGAIVGTPLRFFISGVVARRFGEVFPWGTLIVNVSGCVVAGLVLAMARARGFGVASDWWLLVVTGFLGSYTTVSSFALQTRALVGDAEYGLAAGYVGLSVVLCPLAVAIGFAVAGL